MLRQSISFALLMAAPVLITGCCCASKRIHCDTVGENYIPHAIREATPAPLSYPVPHYLRTPDELNFHSHKQAADEYPVQKDAPPPPLTPAPLKTPPATPIPKQGDPGDNFLPPIESPQGTTPGVTTQGVNEFRPADDPYIPPSA
ncbi:hypothetical protein SH668x_001829 [Planctomicrobium sp. SH668]|uniref:hypothetical protein n=1 Tax=Planctomicrobium sp. SH668 TaxID=3448126 RepID=UPI003F5C12EC